MSFGRDFRLLTGHEPFPWQEALYSRMRQQAFPAACDLPTGLGKTSVIAIWLLALAANAALPRRLVYVVNRRTVVDQATTEAEGLAARLLAPEASALSQALQGLAALPAQPGRSPLLISTLRGERADNGLWRRDPAAPAVVIGTVDMVGSRLLFSGYGCGWRTRPVHAGLLGQDSLLVHDEAHLEPAFQQLLEAVTSTQQRCGEARALRLMALTATGRQQPDFQLSAADLAHPVVQARLQARKGVNLQAVASKGELPGLVAQHAARLEGKVIVFLSEVEHAEKCAALLRKARGAAQVELLTGTLRGHERDTLVRSPVFARFLPRPDAGVALATGSVFLVATAAGEVGIDLSADHLLTDLPPFDSLAQRLGRVNRYGEGDAMVEVFCEPLTAPSAAADGTGRDGAEKEDGDDERPALATRKQFEAARLATHGLIAALPLRADGRRDASPQALAQLPLALRQAAATPSPVVRPVDDMLFDRWSFTTLSEPLPGRPLVAQWLHGQAEWEPPRLQLAWREEVAWLQPEHLGSDTLADFLADYPLRPRELLSDRSDRILKRLEKLQASAPRPLRAWLVTPDDAGFWNLNELLAQHDPKRRPWPEGTTLVLEPQAGGLTQGMLDGGAPFTEGMAYDLGPQAGERVVSLAADDAAPPTGMRLVRAIRRQSVGDEDEEPLWWRLYAAPQGADDDGSFTSRRRQTLVFHLGRAEHWARRIGQQLALPAWQQQALGVAARAHDLGKARRVWQRAIRNPAEPWLAKGPMQPWALGNYRHELGSLNDMLELPAFGALTPQEQALALHTVAAHHGRARPHFPPHEAHDAERPIAKVQQLVTEVPLRFDRLQTQLGRWQLAWLEALLRAADVLASDDEEPTA